MISVLLCFKYPNVEDPNACHAGLGVTASNCAMSLREVRIDADAFPITNGEYLWAKLNTVWLHYTHVVMSAPFIDSVFLGKLCTAFPLVHFAVVYHSNLGFLSVDRFAAHSLPLLLALEAAHPNFTVAANCAEMANAITGATGTPLTLLPNLYHLPALTQRAKGRWMPPMAMNVGLFGAARVLKNWLTAVVAVLMLQRKVQVPITLNINSGRDEGAGGTRASLADLLTLNSGVKLVEVPWMSSDDFHRYLFGMDLLFQPSFTETFNNITADGVSCGVPSVISDSITWAPADWMAKADSASDCADVALHLLTDATAPARGWQALDSYNTNSMAHWHMWLAAA